MMKYFFKLAVLSCLLITGCKEAEKTTNHFVQVKEHRFFIDKEPYYYIGTNYWYGGVLGMEDKDKAGRERLISELDFLKENGVVNLRVMAAVEGSGRVNGVERVAPALQTAPGVFNDSLLKGIDFLLAEMGKRNMKAVLFLSNNWEWSGGFLQYVNWFNRVEDTVVQRKLNWDEQRDITAAFYDCEPCMQAYWKQVEYIVGRRNSITGQLYVNDPVIMAWQLANEPRPMRPAADEQYISWIKKTAALIKRLDKNHLVSIGQEGEMATDGDLALYEKIHADENVDYLTIHIWAKNWRWFEEQTMQASIAGVKERAAAYIALHDSIAVKLKRPLVIEEFGFPRDQHQFTIQSGTTLRDDYFKVILDYYYQSRQQQKNVAGVNFWAFGGKGRPAEGRIFWKKGDDFTGDPPMEEQGLNTIFDADTSTWKLINTYK